MRSVVAAAPRRRGASDRPCTRGAPGGPPCPRYGGRSWPPAASSASTWGGRSCSPGRSTQSSRCAIAAPRLARADDAEALLERSSRPSEEARRGGARRRSSAVGLGVPGLVDPATGVGARLQPPAAGRLARARRAGRAPRPARRGRQRRQRGDPRRVRGRRRSRGAHAIMLTLGTGIGGGLLVDGRVVHGAAGRGGRARAHGRRPDGPTCPGDCPNHGCLEALAPARRSGRAGARRARANPDAALGRARQRARDHRRARHRAGPRRRPGGARRWPRSGGRLGLGIVTLVEHLQPRGGGGRWRSRRGGRAVAGAGPGGGRRTRAAGRFARGPDRPARFGAKSGMLGAACMALDWRRCRR